MSRSLWRLTHCWSGWGVGGWGGSQKDTSCTVLCCDSNDCVITWRVSPLNRQYHIRTLFIFISMSWQQYAWFWSFPMRHCVKNREMETWTVLKIRPSFSLLDCPSARVEGRRVLVADRTQTHSHTWQCDEISRSWSLWADRTNPELFWHHICHVACQR